MCRYQGKQNMQDVVVWLEQGSFPVKLVLPCNQLHCFYKCTEGLIYTVSLWSGILGLSRKFKEEGEKNY